MKSIQQYAVVLLVLACAGCTRSRRIAGLYVPARCIQKVSWTKPCASVSEHLVKCDGVMVTANCVSVREGDSRRLEREKLPEAQK